MHHGSNGVRIIHVPLDLGASCHGASLGPAALRQAGLIEALTRDNGGRVSEEWLAVATRHDTDAGPDPRARFKTEILQLCRRLAERNQSALETGRTPLVIGGDHALAMGSVAGVANHLRSNRQALGLLWFDAHADINTPASSPSGNLHGMPLAHLLGYGDRDLATIASRNPAINPRHLVIVGARDIDPGEQGLLREAGIQVIGMEVIREKGMHYAAQQALEAVTDGTAGFHLSFDVDACDPAEMPGTGLHVANGVSLADSHVLFRACASSGRLTSMDVAELNPRLDHRGKTARELVALLQTALDQTQYHARQAQEVVSEMETIACEQ